MFFEIAIFIMSVSSYTIIHLLVFILELNLRLSKITRSLEKYGDVCMLKGQWSMVSMGMVKKRCWFHY